MNNLPIMINLASAQMSSKPVNANTNAAASQPASNKPASADDDNSAQGAKSFGNELARQVNDSSQSDKPSEAAGKDSAPASTAANKGEKESAVQPESNVVLPADILATLLAAQQAQAGTVQPEAAQLQQIASSQVATTLSSTTALSTDTGATAKLAAAVDNATLQAGQAALAQADGKALTKTALPATNAELLASADTAASKQDATNALKVAGNKEAVQPAMPAAVKEKTNFTEVLNTASKNELAAGLTGESLHSRKLSNLEATALQPATANPATASAQAQAPAVLAAAPASQLTISTPVNQAGWGNEFNQKITWLASQRNQSAELHLNPPQLGPLDVVLKVSGDQAVALFTSPHAAVRDAIEQALPKLRDMLADNGIMLGNATVSDQSAQKDPEGWSRTPQGTGTVLGQETEVTAVHALGGRVQTISRHNGMVDTFA